MLIYPTIEDVIAIRGTLVDIYSSYEQPEKIENGFSNKGLIGSIIDLAQRDYLSGEPFIRNPLQKASIFLYYLNISHPFTDGNKRTSLVVTFFFFFPQVSQVLLRGGVDI